MFLSFYILLFAHFLFSLSHTHTRATLEFFYTFVVAAAALRAHCALAATTTAAAAAAGSRILQIVAAAFGHFKSENVLLAENDRERERTPNRSVSLFKLD